MPIGVYARTKPHYNKGKKCPNISKALKGRKLSKEHIEKLRKIKLENPIRYWLGKKRPSLSVETKKKMSDTHKRIGTKPPIRYGEDNNLWRGGTTPKNRKIRMSIEFRLWRESVFARDNWICQKCEERGIELHPHHIKNFAQYPELRFAIDNGITFCKKCHMKFHKIYGYKNNTMEQIKEFLLVDENLKINNKNIEL